MPHISKGKLNAKMLREIDTHLLDFLVETTPQKRRRIFKEVLTKTERMMLAKRLGALYLIGKGVPTHTISKVLHMSSSTIARFEVMVESGRYSETESWFRSNTTFKKFLSLFLDMTDIFLSPRKKSLGKFIDDRYGR